ncbi:hypothetical protein WA1_06490 [Scytonema hofmannii PCC 7110]|uniref:Amidohydrolase-related domain-containing protein n=1 Tax=Scytonema hofmannii PCC 7110 TaxID=128403 RepID=A0A139WSR8_9CYAN|nr:amidohydrolase family protein [Scytonema hofmannii]KYC35469.1 hypothetical protein WA1_06490 [Scytonema hofmannii PCC 7110]
MDYLCRVVLVFYLSILAHACGALPSDIEILSKYPVGIAHAPKTYFKLAMDIPPITEFRLARINVGLATDGAASNNTLDIWELLRLLALSQKSRQGIPQVLPVPEALYIATRESARVFGMGEQIGILAPGYLADLILIDLTGVHHQPNHNIPANLVYSMHSRDVNTVIVDGKIIMRERQILTVDKTEVISQVQAIVKRFTQIP